MRGTAVTDTFTRTLASGWGSADTGQAWTAIGAGGTINATDWSVGSGLGVHSVPVTNAYRMSYLATFSQAFADVAVTVKLNRSPIVGGPVEPANLITRATDTVTYYLFRLQIAVGGALTATIFAPGGAQLATITVPGITYTGTSQLIRVRAQSIGRIHRMKAWDTAKAEPAAWVLSATDSTYLGAGFVGVRSGVATGNTNTLPVVFSYDDFASALLPDFPKDKLPLTVLAAFGADLSADPSTWPWTNITADVRAGSVSIIPGRRDETGQASPAGCSFQLKNGSRAYSANNPMSPNYPNVKRNTPVWVIVDPATRFFGYANGWIPSWDTSGKVPVVSVSASGILRRLTQGKTPLRSTLYRVLSRSGAAAYWPLEDGPQADHLVAIGGGTAVSQVYINATGPAEFGALQPPTGASTMPNFIRGGSLILQVSSPVSTAWTLEFSHFFGTGEPARGDYSTPSSMNLFVAFAPNGDYWEFQVTPHNAIFPNGRVALFRSDADEVIFDTLVDVSLAASYNPWDGRTHHVAVTAAQSGSNINWQLFLDGSVFASGTLLSRTLRPMDRIMLNQNGFLASSSVYGMGHVAFYESVIAPASHARAAQGWSGETATARLARLCAEEGVPIAITGTSDSKMGPQGVDAFVPLLRECEQADLGLLYDGFGPGLTYITRAARYNQPAALTLDMAAGQVAPPFAPADDDQRNRNLYKVDRKGGSSAVYQDKTGPLGTDPIKGIGTYDSSATLNVSADDVLYGYASWLVHMGTVEGFRYPSLNIDLAASPELIDDWMAARLNARIDVLNISSKATGHAPGTVSLLDEGYTETLGPKTWKIAANASRHDPWRVLVVGTDRVDTAGAQLTAGVNATATTIQVTTTVGPAWGFADGAFDINVGGERMTVTNVTPLGSSPQTFTVVRSVNGVVKSQAANAPVSLWRPPVVAL